MRRTRSTPGPTRPGARWLRVVLSVVVATGTAGPSAAQPATGAPTTGAPTSGAPTSGAPAVTPSSHVQPPATRRVRTKLGPDEGYLTFAANPLGPDRGRLGDEWTGWVDVRHPSLAGTPDRVLGFDRSDRLVQVRSSVLLDRNGRLAPETRAVDFDFANKAFVYQGGITALETGVRDPLKSPAAGEPGSFTLALDDPTDPADPRRGREKLGIVEEFNRQSPPRIETYYGRLADPRGVLFGVTAIPSEVEGLGNEAIFLDAVKEEPFIPGFDGLRGFPDRFAHELYHFVGDEPEHSRDPRNLMGDGDVFWAAGMPKGIRGERPEGGGPPWDVPHAIDVVGPALSSAPDGAPRVGGIDQLTRDQIARIFGFPRGTGAEPWFPGRQRGHNDAAADVVDWDFVADQPAFQLGGAAFGLEGMAGGGDNHAGVDSLFWAIGGGGPSLHQTPILEANSGHDHSGLGVFSQLDPMDRFTGDTFGVVDVFSITARYADSDVDPPKRGPKSRRESALDYELAFLAQDGVTIVGGIPVIDFVDGWSLKSHADDHVVRWRSPVPAIGVFVRALEFGVAGHDGTAQIDAIIAATDFIDPPDDFPEIPEPATALLVATGLLACAMLKRRALP